jgi:hypothetical protein
MHDHSIQFILALNLSIIGIGCENSKGWTTSVMNRYEKPPRVRIQARRRRTALDIANVQIASFSGFDLFNIVGYFGFYIFQGITETQNFSVLNSMPTNPHGRPFNSTHSCIEPCIEPVYHRYRLWKFEGMDDKRHEPAGKPSVNMNGSKSTTDRP